MSNFEFDPTKTNGGLEGLPKRAIGQIVIQFDPNTGGMAFQSQGMTPIEEIGASVWFTNLRMKAFLEANDNKQVVLAPPGARIVPS